jgi:tRNA-2-methylthio-N6-dimethylallyladenosine synthase
MSVREEQQKYIQIMQQYTEGKRLKYHIVTYGCQMNVHDSEKLAGMLQEMGYEEAQSLKMRI